MSGPASLTGDADWDWAYIEGAWSRSASDDRLQVCNPYDGSAIATVPSVTEEHVDAAVVAAERAQPDWGALPIAERQAYLEGLAAAIRAERPALAALLAEEAGTTTAWQMVEFEYARGILDWSAGLDAATFDPAEHPSTFSGKRNFIQRIPSGVVGVIAPWNMPFFLAFRTIAPALAAGNTVVLKPAEDTPIIGGLAIAHLADRVDLPAGVLNVVPGDGPGVGAALAGHPAVDVVSFTGSVEAGRSVASAAGGHLAEVALELGGNAPYVVLPDADLEDAITIGTAGSFLHQGQLCISINRHIVHEAVYEAYVEGMAERVSGLTTGDPTDASTIVGPLINDAQRDRVLAFIEASVDEGATIVTGGGADGRVVEPTVLRDVSPAMPAACNEHFGPVVPVIPAADTDEAVEIANDTRHRLSSAVVGGDLERARAVADRLRFGMTHVNDIPVHDEPHMPFGGIEDAGVGRVNGEWIIDHVTETRWISEQHEPRDYLVF